jgi:hypothetical protein
MVCHRLSLHPLGASGKQRFRRTDFQVVGLLFTPTAINV